MVIKMKLIVAFEKPQKFFQLFIAYFIAEKDGRASIN